MQILTTEMLDKLWNSWINNHPTQRTFSALDPDVFFESSKMKLAEDFNIWWNMPRYKDIEIEAKRFSEVEIKVRNGSNVGWPGPERDVKYWVELENGWAVGIQTPRKKLATFPCYEM